ncbi:MAG: NAD(P)H-dependent oxidoreductase [Alphaproteobacteria bacterium]|nr:NAD(P)H-dependent oxidoreductase [Alphaproteobacteria bacterium]
MDLVVFAHPRADSLSGRALQRIIDGARGPVVAADLYGQGFSPVLSASDFARYGQPPNDPLVTTYQRQLAEARSVTFVFPVWMYGLPAMLKGYFDRVWTPGATFAFRDGVPVGLLTQVKAINVVCSFGQERDFYGHDGDPIMLFFKQLVSQNCEPDCTIRYEPLFGTDGVGAPAVAAYLDKVAGVLARA